MHTPEDRKRHTANNRNKPSSLTWMRRLTDPTTKRQLTLDMRMSGTPQEGTAFAAARGEELGAPAKSNRMTGVLAATVCPALGPTARPHRPVPLFSTGPTARLPEPFGTIGHPGWTRVSDTPARTQPPELCGDVGDNGMGLGKAVPCLRPCMCQQSAARKSGGGTLSRCTLTNNHSQDITLFPTHGFRLYQGRCASKRTSPHARACLRLLQPRRGTSSRREWSNAARIAITMEPLKIASFHVLTTVEKTRNIPACTAADSLASLCVHPGNQELVLCIARVLMTCVAPPDRQC